MYKMESVARFLSESTESFSDRPLIHDSRSGECVTFEQLNVLVGKAAALLHDAGIHPGDTAAIFLGNRMEFFLPWLGAARLGAVSNPINLGIEKDIDRIIYMLGVTGARIFITEKIFAQTAEKVRSKAPGVSVVVIDDAGISDFDWDTGIRQLDPMLDDYPVSGSSPFQMIFTSGTTGKPKAVVQRHEMVADAFALRDHFRISQEDISMAVLPFFHVNAQYTSFFPVLSTGGSMVLCNRFTNAGFFTSIKRFSVTYVSVVPSILTRLLAAGIPPRNDFSSLKFIICGAAPLSEDVHRRFMQQSGVTVANGWGMTENGCWGCHSPLDDIRPGSIGRALDINEMKIVDRNTLEDIGPGKTGGLFIRGDNVFEEYFRAKEATSEAFRLGSGWFDTGDDAWQDEDGFFYFSGRQSVDTGKIEGEFVNFLTLDERLWSHPDIQEVCCVGVPHPISGQVVAACVVPRNGDKFSTLELIKYCKSSGFAPFEIPRHVLFVEDIPKGDTGKIQRNVMTEVACHHLGK